MRLNKIFQSHMVFAANKPIRVFGDGTGTAEILFAGSSNTVYSDGGNWIVEFPPMEYGGPYKMAITLNGIKTILEDIYIGEVYLFAGQSNMQFKCKEANKPQKLYDPNGKVRFFVTDKLEQGEMYNSDSGWLVCDDTVSQNLSAVGYFTSCEICSQKNIAVGGVGCYQGASVIESWVPKDTFKNIGIDIPIEKRSDAHVCLPEWNNDGCLYHYNFSSVVPFSFSAIVWYQGEADSSCEEARVYSRELAALINVWRNDLKDNNLLFIVIQLADFEAEGIDPEGWTGIQKAQLEVSDMLHNVKTVICRDICEKDDIHPPTKDKLACRIADALV